jgi:hypothetical protein
MSKGREYVDKDHKVMTRYYDLCDGEFGRNERRIKLQLRLMIEDDPDFLDPYLYLADISDDEGQEEYAAQLREDAYNRAIKLRKKARVSGLDM